MRTDVNLPPLEERISRLLELIAVKQRSCMACGEPLFFVQHASGKLTPYTRDGLNHFITCPQAERFRKGSQHATAAKA